MNDFEHNFDVAIIGAGPAGSSLAYFLGKAGFKVILIDKDKFPRNKVCAGGLPVKISRVLPFDISSIIEKDIYEVTLTYKLKKDYKRICPKPLLHIVSREIFDNFLVRQATKIGVIFLEGQIVESLHIEENTWIVKLADKVINASVLVGADGATGFVSKRLSLKPSDHFHIGLQYEIPIHLFKNAECLKRGIVIDWGSFKDSYGWIFPKKESALIGVGGPIKNGKQLKIYLDDFSRCHGISPENQILMGHLIPHRTHNTVISTKRALLIGDAAGFVDYWTGEGIFYAIKSSQIAARQIIGFLKKELSLDEYERAVNEEIMPEIRTSYQFSKIFNYLSFLAFKIIREYDYPWDIFCRIMRGDRTFSDLKKRFRPDILLSKILVKSRRGHLGKK
jgi:menaquinone-9 beta-reductase